MPQIDIEKLIKNLDSVCRSSLEAAAALAASSSHQVVDVGHWLKCLLDDPDVAAMVERCGISLARVRDELNQALSDQPLEGGASLTLSQTLILWAREAFVLATLQYGRRLVSPAGLLAALTEEPTLRSTLRGLAPSLRTIDRVALGRELVAASETEPSPARAGGLAGTEGLRPAASGGNEFLDLYTQDLTAVAREGRLDPVIGRENELRQVIDVLMRRRQNNPILVGEAGVGKTAIAEALALAIVAGELPEKLSNVRLLSLDLGLLQAGAGVKGEFERRLRGVVDAVKASAEPIILFIDEAHMLIGAGPQAGQSDAANLLKPALARGELRTLAATTFSEYKRYIEKDAALSRRFQAVTVGEPDEATAVAMLRGIADRFERHHEVVIRHSALVAAVALSARYIPERQLPDKAISLIDTAAAAVALARQASPEPIRAADAEMLRLATERKWLAREPASAEIDERMGAIAARQDDLAATIVATRERHQGEMQMAAEADRLEARLAELLGAAPPKPMGGDGDPSPGGGNDAVAENVAPFPDPGDAIDVPKLQASLARVEGRLRASSGREPLVPRVVDDDAVAGVVARWTGIPVGKLLADQVATAQSLDRRLAERIVGQEEAIKRVAATMRSARAGLSDPRRPPAVFLFVGLSGTGKTETALALADILYGGPQHLTTINMSEFKEEHKVSMLVGSPPGYVGYGEGGVLTEAIRRRPYGVLLLDEIDKAHPGVQDVFYQMFDRGILRDGEGRDVDFKNTTIVMTANTGADLIAQLAEDPDTMPTGEALVDVLGDTLKAAFKPAFLGRTSILPFRPLDKDSLGSIVDMQIDKVRARVRQRYGTELSLAANARDHLVASARSSDTGARAIEAMIARDLLPELSSLFLTATLDGKRIKSLAIQHRDKGGFGLSPRYAKTTEFAGPEAAPAKQATDEPAPGGPDVAEPRQASKP